MRGLRSEGSNAILIDYRINFMLSGYCGAVELGVGFAAGGVDGGAATVGAAEAGVAGEAATGGRFLTWEVAISTAPKRLRGMSWMTMRKKYSPLIGALIS